MCISKLNTLKGEQIHFHIMEEKFRLMYGSLYDQYIRYEKFYWPVIKNSFIWTLKCVSIQKPNKQYKMMKCIQIHFLFSFLPTRKQELRLYCTKITTR